MAKTPILGGNYVTRSPNAAYARMVNLFPEAVPEGGKEAAFLSRCPGLKFYITLGSGPIRGMWQFGNYGYVVSGTSLYQINSAGSASLLGSVSGSSAPVSMADNGYQLFIACGGPSYIYNTNTGILQQITDPDFPGAETVCYLDGYFVFNEPNSQKIWCTAILNGTDIDALDFASAEGSPDNIVAIIADHREIWVFGEQSTEVWYNVSAGADFPLSRIQGAFNEFGCAAPFSVCKMDNGLFWVGKDARGTGMVYRANGYKADRISNHSMEWQIQQYPIVSDAVGYTYQQEGHSFYVLNFPSGNATWVFDVSTGEWHERAAFNTSTGQLERHWGVCQMFFNNLILIGDYRNGNVYSFDMTTYSDNGNIQKWLRSWRVFPPGQNNLKGTAQHELQIDMQTGVGLDGVGQGTDPQLMLRWSDDAGHNWSSTKYAKMGRIGRTDTRVMFRRLGMTEKLRDRIYEISGTDPVKVVIMGAEVRASPTSG